MSVRHGFEIRGLDVPRGANPPTGRFGRMFPTLEARPPTGLPMAEKFGLPQGLVDGGFTSHGQDSPTMDAGFTFFGQFIDHNLTSMLGRQVDPEAIHNFRVPMLDLDHLYGTGPFANPHLYDTKSDNTKRVLSLDGVDLARTVPGDGSAGVALIGDPRNDENLLLNHVHLTFIKFHDQVVDALFAKAQQIVRWHYQWIIVHEFLPLVAGQDSVDRVNEHGLQFFAPNGHPFIPVDFKEPPPQDPHQRTDLRGGPVAPEFAVDFTKFFAVNGERPQRVKRIEAKLNTRLLDLPRSPTCRRRFPGSCARWRCAICFPARPRSCPPVRTWPARSARRPSPTPSWAPPARSTSGSTSSKRPSCGTTAAGWDRSGPDRHRGPARPARRRPDVLPVYLPDLDTNPGRQRRQLRHR
jgi:hypothetical protein